MSLLRDALDGATPSEQAGVERVRSTLPSLPRLTLDVQEDVITNGLTSGFGSKRSVVEWEQKTIVRTLGELPEAFVRELGEWIVSSREPIGLAVLLDENARESDLAERLDTTAETVQDVVGRERTLLRQTIIDPAFERAYNRLRADATEHTDTNTSDRQDPTRQAYLSMRPGLNELDAWQEHALTYFLDGLDEEQLGEWGYVLKAATDGNPLVFPSGNSVPPTKFAYRVTREPAALAAVTGGAETISERVGMAGRLFMPAFRQAVRSRFYHAGETPSWEASKSDRSIPHG